MHYVYGSPLKDRSSRMSVRSTHVIHISLHKEAALLHFTSDSLSVLPVDPKVSKRKCTAGIL